jgi:very-short-patch-repair endonuclease
VGGTVSPLLEELDRLCDLLKLNRQISFGVDSADQLQLKDLNRRLRDWLDDLEGLSKWVGLRLRLEEANRRGLSDLNERLWEGRIKPHEAIDQFQYAYYEAMMRHLFDLHSALASFDGNSHSQILEAFKRLDRDRITLARQEVAHRHYKEIPRSGGAGEIGVVRREIEKKRRHLPLRKLLNQAGTAIQSIKPVFMMSPMSVAQFLEPGSIEFDLLLIDEASQVQPVDALGAIARSRQIVVVGDDKQLPPTRFFARGMGDIEGEDIEGVDPGDLESILGLCSAQGVPNRMLRWHYRSRHESLIAVSNHEFYDDRLFIVPSAHEVGPTLGVTFHHVADGVYDRGGSATNAREARVVAEAAIEHARQYPDYTLGVGTFSIRQKEAILNELEHLWRTETDVKDFFASGVDEPFFVKNLENIQGDERDVIMISVCYGPDRHGYFAMGFGPLSSEGGERRLNVLISRARRSCRVFSSITADQIDLNRAKGRGVAAFKTFLNFAETGNLSVAMPTGKDFDSPFEEEVARAVQRLGYEVEPQVGIAGFFVDLAIIDPRAPGRYLLGIECDGAAYHSARCARDRDRLRQQVLEDHGWIIHRVWSTDWFHRPEEQLRKIATATEQAKLQISAASESTAHTSRQPERQETHIIERGVTAEAHEDAGSQFEALPYSETSFEVDTTLEPHEVPTKKMAEIAARVVWKEGPVHRDEVARRVSSLWGFKRTGSRISQAVNAGLSLAARADAVTNSGHFYDTPDRAEPSVRDRSAANSSTLRKPEMLPPSEIRFALEKVVESYIGITPDDAAVEVARLFGFKATSAQLRDVITREIPGLVDLGPLKEKDGKLYIAG